MLYAVHFIIMHFFKTRERKEEKRKKREREKQRTHEMKENSYRFGTYESTLTDNHSKCESHQLKDRLPD